jgi:hypothetical protein
MSDGQSDFRHYSGLGETCGKMVVSVRTPVLNIIDAIWVSHSSLSGYPATTTFRANQILCSQDPVALDYLAAASIMYPISKNPRHLPDFPSIDQWLTSACNIINTRGGLYNPDNGIFVNRVTKNEDEMVVYKKSVAVTLLAPNGGEVIPSGSTYTIQWGVSSQAVTFRLKYSLDNGMTWMPIPGADEVTGNSYDWKVPKPLGNRQTCFVKVIGYKKLGVKVGADRSDSHFAIEVVRLDSPKGGDILTAVKTYPITWITSETKDTVAKVKLYYTKDGGNTWNLIKTLKGNPGNYSWLVQTVTKARTQCKVKVELKDSSNNMLAEDASNGYFTIQP